jgi:predicted nucleotidyltransferase
MKYGLSEEVITKISSVFAEYPQIQKVILYGSRAKGNYKNGSDIDLSLVSDATELSLLHKIENSLDDLLLPYSFDLHLYNEVKNSELKEHIDRVGIEFYKGSKNKQSVSNVDKIVLHD